MFDEIGIYHTSVPSARLRVPCLVLFLSGAGRGLGRQAKTIFRLLEKDA